VQVRRGVFLVLVKMIGWGGVYATRSAFASRLTLWLLVVGYQLVDWLFWGGMEEPASGSMSVHVGGMNRSGCPPPRARRGVVFLVLVVMIGCGGMEEPASG